MNQVGTRIEKICPRQGFYLRNKDRLITKKSDLRHTDRWTDDRHVDGQTDHYRVPAERGP